MEYSQPELYGPGILNKSILESGSDYTFFLYRPPNVTDGPSSLSGSGYFTFESKRNATGSFAGVPLYTKDATLNPEVGFLGSNSFGVNNLILDKSHHMFSYNLFLTTSSGVSATSSFQYKPGVTTPVGSVFFRATGGYEMEVQPETQTCGVQQQYQGGQAYPTHLQSILGSGLGNPILTAAPQSIPDRWRVEWNGGIEIDTGYISLNPTTFDEGGAQRAAFNNSLLGRAVPESPGQVYPQPAGGVAPNIIRSDGYPQVGAIGTYSFSKNQPTSIADVSVYGPMIGTLWSSTLSCP